MFPIVHLPERNKRVGDLLDLETRPSTSFTLPPEPADLAAFVKSQHIGSGKNMDTFITLLRKMTPGG
jgi:hypothetical protein